MIKIENIKYWIWLSLLKGIGSRKCLTLLEKYQTPEKIYMPETITDINSVININLNNDFYLTIIIEVFIYLCKGTKKVYNRVIFFCLLDNRSL